MSNSKTTRSAAALTLLLTVAVCLCGGWQQGRVIGGGVLGSPTSGGTGPALVQVCAMNQSSSVSTLNVTASCVTNITAGHALLIVNTFGTTSTVLTGISDTQGNLAPNNCGGDALTQTLCFAPITTGGTDAITITSSASGGSILFVAELKNVGADTGATTSTMSEAGSTVTATNSLSISANQWVHVYGCSIAGYNGIFVVAGTGSGNFTYTAASGLGASPTGCNVAKSPVDRVNSATLTSSTSWSGGAVTPSVVNDMIFFWGGNVSTNNTFTAGNLTLPSGTCTNTTTITAGQCSGGNQSGFLEYEVDASTSAFTPTITLNTAMTGITGTVAILP